MTVRIDVPAPGNVAGEIATDKFDEDVDADREMGPVNPDTVPTVSGNVALPDPFTVSKGAGDVSQNVGRTP